MYNYFMRIGLVLNILDDKYQLYLYSGIVRKAEELGIEIVCFQQENTHFSSDELITRFPRKEYFDLDGIILLTTVMIDNYEINKKEDVERIWGDIPVVSLGQWVEGIPSLFVEGEKSMKELVEHLIVDHKYRNFLFIAGPKSHPDAKMRRDVFENTMKIYKNQIPELTYDIKHEEFTEIGGIYAMTGYYSDKNHKNLDCVVCANDNMAIGVYKYFKMNSDNPNVHECAVTGFDDIPQAKYEIPSLTTIQQPLNELGEKAVYVMKDLIEKRPFQQNTVLSSKVVYRQSCGCNSNGMEKLPGTELLQQIQVNYVQSENLLKLVNHVALDMNYAESITDLSNIINRNVGQLDLNNFCLLRFSNDDGKMTERKSNAVLVDPLYVRRNKQECYEFYRELKIPLGQFYKHFLKLGDSTPTSIVFKYLTTGNEIIGCVLFDSHMDALPYLNAIAINIAQGLNRIRAVEERQRRSEYLEREVSKRTRELVEANNKRMEVEAEVLKISELERQRFSNDLHDDICQRLAGISMLCRSYSNQDKPVEKAQMVELAELISDTLQTTRQYAHNSYPVELESLGMNHSLSNLCNSFRNQSGIECIYNWNVSDDIELDNTQKLNIFRIIQEALHNVLKHSRATSVTVNVQSRNQKIEVQVIDNGCGISTEKNDSKPGLGLNSMEYRANQIGAKFLIKRNKPSGTCVQISLNL